MKARNWENREGKQSIAAQANRTLPQLAADRARIHCTLVLRVAGERRRKRETARQRETRDGGGRGGRPRGQTHCLQAAPSVTWPCFDRELGPLRAEEPRVRSLASRTRFAKRPELSRELAKLSTRSRSPRIRFSIYLSFDDRFSSCFSSIPHCPSPSALSETRVRDSSLLSTSIITDRGDPTIPGLSSIRLDLPRSSPPRSRATCHARATTPLTLYDCDLLSTSSIRHAHS